MSDIVERLNSGDLKLPKMDGAEIAPDVWLIGEPTPVPGSNRMRCLANVGGALAVVELSLKFLETGATS